jgi:hypothetical protein
LFGGSAGRGFDSGTSDTCSEFVSDLTIQTKGKVIILFLTSEILRLASPFKICAMKIDHSAEARVAGNGRAKKPPTKRRSRAVLTKEQAIEVYEQKLINETPSAAADVRATANAAVVARRCARHSAHS